MINDTDDTFPKGDTAFQVARMAAPLRHGVTESIRNAIALGRFKAGDRLPERELCELTGVSRTLVRETLRQLESEGLITVVPHRGPVVASLSPQQAHGIYQVREELEGLACQLFASGATEEQRQALRRAFTNLKKAYKASDPLPRLQAKNYFYDCLFEGSGNEALGISLRMLNSRIMLLRAMSLQAKGRSQSSIAELTEIVEALEERDPKRARKAAVHHVREAAKAAIALMDASSA
jgi:DNA-binding GntR family transcriptional regulator